MVKRSRKQTVQWEGEIKMEEDSTTMIVREVRANSSGER